MEALARAFGFGLGVGLFRTWGDEEREGKGGCLLALVPGSILMIGPGDAVGELETERISEERLRAAGSNVCS